MKPTEEESSAGIIPVLVNPTDFPKMQEAKKKIPYDEPIGNRVPSRAASKRNGSVEKGRRTAKVVFTKKENWDDESPMDEEVVEVEPPTAANDSRKKKQKKKRKLGAMIVDTIDDGPPLSNEATHFRAFARKHFSIILRRMGKIQKYIDPNLSSSQVENFFILLITFILSSEELFERKTSSHQEHSI